MGKLHAVPIKKQKKDKVQNKRVPCPYCKELILFGAKKCRFCKETLTQEDELVEGQTNFFKKKIVPSAPYKVWVLSMLVFLVSMSQLQNDNNSYWLIAMLSSIVVGFIAFFTLVVSIPQSKSRYGLITLLTFILFFGVMFNYETLASAFGLNSYPRDKVSPVSDSAKTTASPSLTPSLTPTTLPTRQPSNSSDGNLVEKNKVDCIGPDGKQFNTTMEDCKNLNEKWGKQVNYIVNCIIPTECGGGSRTMSKSECDKPCQVINNNDNEPQQKNGSGSNLNFYCYDNTYKNSYYTSSGEQCNLDNIKSACRGVYQSSYDMCAEDCTWEAKKVSDDCIYNHDEPETTTCLSENSVKHKQCLDSCGSTYQSNLAKCN